MDSPIGPGLAALVLQSSLRGSFSVLEMEVNVGSEQRMGQKFLSFHARTIEVRMLGTGPIRGSVKHFPYPSYAFHHLEIVQGKNTRKGSVYY